MSVLQVKSVVKTRENGSTYFEDRWVVKCDQCDVVHNKEANEAGLADYHARRAGFKTVLLARGKALRWIGAICAKRLVRKAIA